MKAKTLPLVAALLLAVGCTASCTKDDNPGAEQPTPTPEPDGLWVDLGLPSGLLWATHNVGAAAPEESGDYFAWGETATKSTYNRDTYTYYTDGSYTKYTGSDGQTTLLPEDDAAMANWGNGARTPTKAEWDELTGNTTVEWTTENGVNGRRFTAPNGNSLFLPAAGFWGNDELGDTGGGGYYWSATRNENHPGYAWSLCFDSDDHDVVSFYNRHVGFQVRAVRASQD